MVLPHGETQLITQWGSLIAGDIIFYLHDTLKHISEKSGCKKMSCMTPKNTSLKKKDAKNILHDTQKYISDKIGCKKHPV